MSLVSVIIPIYNVEAYIERCVRSLFEQSLRKEIEYIFVDDCTPDKSIETLNKVIDEYSDRKICVKIISHSQNKGVASARNTGLNHATGEYIGWVDPDDWIEDNMFESLYFTAKNFDADVVWCDYSSYGQIEKICKQNLRETPQALLDAILKDGFLGVLWNKLIKRNLFVEYEIQFLDGINMAEDLNVLSKILGVSSIVKYVQESLYHYNICNNQSLMTKNNESATLHYFHNRLDAVQFLSLLSSSWIREDNKILYKLIAKEMYLSSSEVNGFKLWADTFPETNTYVFRNPHTGFINKIMGWMAGHHWWLLIRIGIRIKRIIRYE